MSAIALLAVTVFAASVLFTHYARSWLMRGTLDIPNERSSHRVPTPRGGGIGFVPALLAGWGSLGWMVPAVSPWVLLAVAGIAAVGFADDRMNLKRRIRFGLQIAAVAVVVAMLPDGPIFQGALPFAADRVAAGFLLLWFVNLYNFMDGIDGLAATEAVCVALGLALLTLFAPLDGAPAALILAASALGFLVFNWPPAKLFMGDVGSLALGLALGYLLLAAAAQGALAPALILPMYFVADASLTVGRRLWRRERIWDAHRQHAYQRAVDGGLSHAAVTLRVAGLNAVLCLLALGALSHPWAAFLAACAVTLVFLVLLPGGRHIAPKGANG